MVRKWFLGLIFVMMTTKDGDVYAKEIGLLSDMTSARKAMYVLGDSSVDCGDNTPSYGLLHRNQSHFPCNGSDATLLPQLLAKKMGLPYTIPFYTQNGSIHGILGGVNFGSSEATILYPGSRSYQSLNQQLRQAFETIQLLHLQLGEDTANTFVKSSIFYLSFGKDDFIDYFLNNSVFKYKGQNFTRILLHQMTNAVRSLYTSNVRKIICAGLVPLGCTPHFLLKFGSLSNGGSSKGCLDEVNTLVSDYNTRLEEGIAAINAELADARVIFCDIYRAVVELISNPKAYGIEDVKNACCGVGRYGGESGCISTTMACREALKHVWWDLDNPTPSVNSLLADSAWSGRPFASVCRPYSLQELLSSSP